MFYVQYLLMKIGFNVENPYMRAAKKHKFKYKDVVLFQVRSNLLALGVELNQYVNLKIQHEIINAIETLFFMSHKTKRADLHVRYVLNVLAYELDKNETDEYRFCRILSLSSGVEFDDIINVVVNVDPKVLRTIMSICIGLKVECLHSASKSTYVVPFEKKALVQYVNRFGSNGIILYSPQKSYFKIGDKNEDI